MIDADKKRFTNIMKTTFKMYDKKLDVDVINMWWSIMSTVSIDAFAAGMRNHIVCPERGQYVPKVADIIAKIGGDRNDRKDAADFAWSVVKDNLNTNENAVFDDPAIHYAIQIEFGSWVEVGMMTDKDEPFRRMGFLRAYAAYKPGLPYQPRLLGRLSLGEATSHGRVDVFTHYIGDKQAALAVEANGKQSKGLTKITPNTGMEQLLPASKIGATFSPKELH